MPILRLAGMPVKTVKVSGKDLARLILDPSLAEVTGKYFTGPKETPSSKESYDEQKGAELWETSAELVQLTPSETSLQPGVAKT